MPLTVATTVPDASTRAEVLRLAQRVEAVDGAPPLSDQILTQLGSAGVVHLLAFDDARLAGYAQLDGGSLEIAAEPEALSPLLAGAEQRTDGPLLAWSHGRASRVAPLLEHRGFDRLRELHQLRRPFEDSAPLQPEPPLAAGVVVRAFEPGRDDDAWLAVNAAAFAAHPEQGRWTSADLDARIAEPWFDAAGFLLAERGAELLGFHWTKVHPDGAGEVYVLGVSPAAQGLGLGSTLLTRGLRHLAQRGCPYVLLYVDGDNPGALHLYERIGFTRYDLDVQWRSR